jgi:carbonic anhydrase
MGCASTNLKVRDIEIKPSVFKNLDAIVGPHRLHPDEQMKAHEAKAIIYSCMDFRLLDDIIIFMDKNGYSNSYDQFILAGASLSFITPQFKHWRKVAKDHLSLAIKLHKIKEVICFEHQQCGAYKMIYPDLKPEDERQKHVDNAIGFEKKLAKSHPDLTFHAYFMNLDGTCDKIN